MKSRLFLTVWIIFTAHAATNVVREHYPAFSLVKNGTFQVDEFADLHPDIFVHTDGHAYIGNNVATSVLASVPLYLLNPVLDALETYEKDKLASGSVISNGIYRVDKPLRQEFFQKVTDRGLTLRFGAATLITTALLIVPLSALCVIAVFQIVSESGVPRRRALWVALLFGLGTPMFFRSAHLTNNMFVMYFTFAAFFCLWRSRNIESQFPVLRLFVAGFCAGMAVACDYSGIVSLVCLYCYALGLRWSASRFLRGFGESLGFVFGCVLPIGFLFYSQWIMYGDPFLPGQYWMPAVNYTEHGWRGFSTPSLETFLLNLFHPSYGLFMFGPILLLGLFPFRSNPNARLVLRRPERLFVMAFVGMFLLFCASNQYSKMQWNTGFRYLLPILPFVFLALCDHLVRWSALAFSILAVPAILHSWVLCMARDCNPNIDTWRFATDFGAWFAQISSETVPASYLRIWNEGFQLPWLRVMQLTSGISHPILSQAWLPIAIIMGCGVIIAGVWSLGRSRFKSQSRAETIESNSERRAPTVAVVVPVLNEAHVLRGSIGMLRQFLREKFPYPAFIVVADNGSTDGTGEIARQLTVEFDDVRLVSLTQRGRGRALRTAWTQTQADIVAYMDVDLSTGLEAFEPMCRAIHEEGFEIATGSRLLSGSKVTRCLKREVLSRGYNLFIKCVLFTRFSDAQCGFKAVSRKVVDEVIPMVQDQHWFFDTELLVLGEKFGYRIKDVPVAWIEDPDTRVKIASTVWEDIKGVFRMRWGLWTGKCGLGKRHQNQAIPMGVSPAKPIINQENHQACPKSGVTVLSQ